MQHAAAFLYYFLKFPDSSLKEISIRRVDFRPIEFRRSESKKTVLDRKPCRQDIVRSWIIRDSILVAATGRRTYLLPQAQASSRREYDPDESKWVVTLWGSIS
ncbi:hypothetical protein EVAR_20610_1 [Eumeta japonica]|uniref:Uncharacterized protein n=1 Tax=Eumeta variegata TaxID=151549 RepID=A0A4C1UT88_EUMVA|nr:hypothetical protein EVAR_20610_1 [Eumeta japonica]